MRRFPKPLKKLGQHFLTDEGVIDRIIESANLSKTDRVFEIGPGRGALTGRILQKGAELWVAEKDSRLADRLARIFISSKLHPICGDILKTDWEIFLRKGANWVFLSNIPYNITAPLFFRLIQFRRYFSKIHIMVQKEVGENIFHNFETGKSKNYGSLSIICEAFFQKGNIFFVSPDAFFPVPKVHSSVLELTPKPALFSQEFLFCDWIKIAFSQRRKKMRNNRHPIFREVFDRLPTAEQKKLGNHRPEEVSPARWQDLFLKAL